MLAVGVSPWLRSDAPRSADRLFCHAYGRAKSASQFIPGWPHSFVALLEPEATSWTGILDVLRLGPEDDATAITAAQLRAVAEGLVAAGHWQSRDPDITIVMDAGYDATRPASVLRDLPVEPVGRIRSDRVMHLPKPPRIYDRKGVRPPRNGPETSVQHQHDHAELPSRHHPDQLLQDGPASIKRAATGRQGVHVGFRSSIAGCREVMFGAVQLRPASGRGRAAGKSQRRDGSAPC